MFRKPIELDARTLAEHLRAIEDAGPSPEPRLVFADWLQLQGHPWGELIMLQHRLDNPANADELARLREATAQLVRRHRGEILGQLSREAVCEFEAGFIRSATLSSAGDGVGLGRDVELLLALPAACMLRSLTLHAEPTSLVPHTRWQETLEWVVDPWGPAFAALGRAPASLLHLALGEAPPTAASAYVRLPDFEALSQVGGRLTRLQMQGYCDRAPGYLELPVLEQLEIRFAFAPPRVLRQACNWHLPSLERLSLWLGGWAYCNLDDLYPAGTPPYVSPKDLLELGAFNLGSGVEAQDLAELLDGLPPGLRHLGIQSAVLTAERCEAIVASTDLARLATLDLSGGTLNDATLEVLIRARQNLLHLETLNLEGNELSAEGAALATRRFPNARVGKQRPPKPRPAHWGSPSQPAFFFRYVSAGE